MEVPGTDTDGQTRSDEELAVGAGAGSMADFEELVTRYETRLFKFLAHTCRNDADGADLTQETFLRVYRHLHRFDPSKSFETWIFTIARRNCIDHLRKRRPVPTEVASEGIDDERPDVLLAEKEAQNDLWDRIRSVLPDVQYQALWLKYVEEMTIDEIARVMRRTATHVKVILFRARTRLVKTLENERPRAARSQNERASASLGRAQSKIL